MKMFTKLALVSSMAISANAMAMQSMDDAALSATTGQDGINIGLGISKVTIDRVLIHDNDGLDYANASFPLTAPTTSGDVAFGASGDAGAIVIGGSAENPTTPGISISTNASALLTSHNLADLVIDTDAGDGTSNGGNSAFLNIAAQVSGLVIDIGEIGVSASNTAGTGPGIRRGNDAGNYNKILSGLTITTGTMDANIQLGATPQGAMIKLDTTMTGGLTISNLGITDSAGGGEIVIGSIKLADASDTDLTLQADVSVKATGLEITTMKTASDIYIAGVRLGSSTAGSIGDIEVQGLNVYNGAAGTTPGAIIKISGH